MTILVAADDEKRGEHVVREGAALSSAFEDDLVVLHVKPQKAFEDVREGRPEYYVDDAATEAAQTAIEIAERALGDAGDVSARGRVGDVTQEILSVADEADVRYVVIGGRNRTPVGKAIFGSTTQSLLLHAEVPVVTVMDESA